MSKNCHTYISPPKKIFTYIQYKIFIITGSHPFSVTSSSSDILALRKRLLHDVDSADLDSGSDLNEEDFCDSP